MIHHMRMLERECKKAMQGLCKKRGWAVATGIIGVLFGACSRPICAPSITRSSPLASAQIATKVEIRADERPTDPRLGAWQGTWVVPDRYSLNWSIVEIHGNAGRVTSSQFGQPGPHPTRVVAVHPCQLDLEAGSPHSGIVERFSIPFVFDGETLHAGTNVAIRSEGRVVACGDYIYAFDGSACRIEMGWPDAPAPGNVTCVLDGDIFFVGGDLLVPMHGDVGWADQVAAMVAVTPQKVLVAAQTVLRDGRKIPLLRDGTATASAPRHRPSREA